MRETSESVRMVIDQVAGCNVGGGSESGKRPRSQIVVRKWEQGQKWDEGQGWEQTKWKMGVRMWDGNKWEDRSRKCEEGKMKRKSQKWEKGQWWKEDYG